MQTRAEGRSEHGEASKSVWEFSEAGKTVQRRGGAGISVEKLGSAGRSVQDSVMRAELGDASGGV